MDEDDENTLTEDLDVGDNYNVDIKPDISEYNYAKKKNCGPRNRCPYGCEKVLAPRTIDYHRTNGCRLGVDEPMGDTTKKRYYCCGVCYAEFVTRCAFYTHLTNEHDVRAEIHKLQFKDKFTFERFLKWIEMEGGAHFRHKSGSKRRASGRGIFMACNRSGYVGTSFSDPIKNRTGPYRTGYTCTAFVHGTEYSDGSLHVEMCGDHYGHDARMRLPNVIKHLIAQKQMDGEAPNDIVNYLKRQFSHFAHENTYAQRICLVDHDELRTLMVSSTKKWEATGIPTDCEIWEEELLDRAGISREGVPRLRELHAKTTQQIAEEEMWPRPLVFVAKLRTDNGFVLLPELYKVDAESRSKMAAQMGCYDDGMIEDHGGDHQHPDYGSLAKDDYAHMDAGSRMTPSPSTRQHPNDAPRASAGEPQPKRTRLVPRTTSPIRDPRFTNRDRVAQPNRKSVMIAINYELQQLRRLTRFETDCLSDTTLFAFSSRLRNIRATTEQAIILQSLNRRGPAYTSGGERNSSTNGGSAQMQPHPSRASASDTFIKTEANTDDYEQTQEVGDVDDEPIVSQIGIQYSSALWS